EKVELVPELGIDVRVGLVAARRHVEIMQQHLAPARLEPDGQVAAITDGAEIAPLDCRDRAAGNGGNTVIALLAMDLDMAVADVAECLERKLVVRALGFLQAQNVGLGPLEKLDHQGETQANRVDVPGSNRQAHALPVPVPAESVKESGPRKRDLGNATWVPRL